VKYPSPPSRRGSTNEAEITLVLGPIGTALIELDCRGAHPLHEAKQLVAQAFDSLKPSGPAREQALRVVREFLAGERELWSVSRTSAVLRFDLPEGVIPDDFVDIDSELDQIPPPNQESRWAAVEWRKLRKEKAAILAEYQRAAREAATELLERLTSSD
jgi:hypothetical protein